METCHLIANGGAPVWKIENAILSCDRTGNRDRYRNAVVTRTHFRSTKRLCYINWSIVLSRVGGLIVSGKLTQ